MRDGDRQQLERVLTLVRDVFGADVTAAYLFGSATLGGLQPESDLDVLAVTRRPSTPEQKQRVVERLLAFSGRQTADGFWRRVELTIVVESEVKPWRFPPSFDFQYGDWLRSEFERGNVSPWPTTTNPDLASLITMVRLADTPLFGPSALELFDPVPHADLVRATVGDIPSLVGDLDRDTRNVILTLARIWSTVATGAIRSKAAAADWALDRLPDEHRGVLAHAQAAYLGAERDRWDDARLQVRRWADYVVGAIEQTSARPGASAD